MSWALASGRATASPVTRIHPSNEKAASASGALAARCTIVAGTLRWMTTARSVLLPRNHVSVGQRKTREVDRGDSYGPVLLDKSRVAYYNSCINEMTNSALARLVHVYKALGHPLRLRILAMLGSGELCACQVTAVLKLAPSTVSAHLSDLKRAGVITERKKGRWVIYRHADDAQAQGVIAKTMASLAGDPRIDADVRIVKRLRRVPLEDLCRAELDLAQVGIKEPAIAGIRNA
jgi:ArsR family transcriptional regulator